MSSSRWWFPGDQAGSLSALNLKHCPLLLSSCRTLTGELEERPSPPLSSPFLPSPPLPSGSSCMLPAGSRVCCSSANNNVSVSGDGKCSFWTLYMETSGSGQDLGVPVFLAIIASWGIRTSKPDSLRPSQRSSVPLGSTLPPLTMTVMSEGHRNVHRMGHTSLSLGLSHSLVRAGSTNQLLFKKPRNLCPAPQDTSTCWVLCQLEVELLPLRMGGDL